MDKTTQQFFALIQLALNSSYPLKREELPSILVDEPIDWNCIYEMANKQAIIGVVFPCIERMPHDMIPPKNLLMNWFGQVMYLKARNEQLNSKCVELTHRYGKDGFSCCILKGQSNNSLYPNGMVRTPGDIDLLIRHADSKDVYANRHYCIRYLRGLAPQCVVQYHHAEMPSEDNISLEVHYTPIMAFTHGVNRRIQEYLWETGILCKVDGLDFYRLPNVPNAIFQMMHIFKHLVIEGVGLRQVIDYFWLLRSMTIEERAEVSRLLPQFRLRKFAGALMYVLQQCCGLSDEYLLVKPDEGRGEYFLSEICKGGNFGRYNQEIDRKAKGKIHNQLMILRLAMRGFRYFPIESLYSPLSRFGSSLWLIRYGYYLKH